MATTIVKIRKTIPSNSNFYLSGGDTEITLNSIIEIAFNSKKELKKSTPGESKTASTYAGKDKIITNILDRKTGSETISIRGYLEDSTEDSGTLTAYTSNSLIDTGKSWTVNAYAGYCVKISHEDIGGPHKYVMKKILSNTATALTISGTWGDDEILAGEDYEIIYPAWTKFWKLRAMCITGGPLTSFTWANQVFSTSTNGVFMESITGNQRSDGTYSIDYAQDEGVARIEVSIDLFLGEVRA